MSLDAVPASSTVCTACPAGTYSQALGACYNRGRYCATEVTNEREEGGEKDRGTKGLNRGETEGRREGRGGGGGKGGREGGRGQRDAGILPHRSLKHRDRVVPQTPPSAPTAFRDHTPLVRALRWRDEEDAVVEASSMFLKALVPAARVLLPAASSLLALAVVSQYCGSGRP